MAVLTPATASTQTSPTNQEARIRALMVFNMRTHAPQRYCPACCNSPLWGSLDLDQCEGWRRTLGDLHADHAPSRPAGGDPRLPRLRGGAGARATAGGAGVVRDPSADLRPGAGTAGARERAALRRSVRRAVAPMDGDRPRSLLRPRRDRRRGDGLLLPGNRPAGRGLSADEALR